MAVMMSKIILIITLSLVACGGAPVMERKVKVYNGSPESGSICRLNSETAAVRTNRPEWIVKLAVDDSGQYECISATDPRFKEFGAMSFDDMGVIQRYIETLISSCRQWK